MMLRVLIAGILLIPGVAFGATLEGQRTVVLSEATKENTYLAGADVRIVAPISADLTAAGANVTVAAPVAGDVLLLGGTLDIDRKVEGDVRAAGARIVVDNEVGGDLSALGGVVLVTGRANDIQMMGGTIRVSGGADGQVTIYGSDVYIAGEYLGNVEVSASDRVTIAEGTVIHGAFRYNAPQAAAIAPDAIVHGGVAYTGAASYLPTSEQAQTFALAGAAVFFFVKALAALVAAGLVVGLFPVFSRRVVERTAAQSPKRLLMLALIGFAIVVATPVLIILLAVSFVGIGVSLIVAALYLLVLMLAYVYAGLLLGSAVLSRFTKRTHASWRAAVLGTFLLYLLGLIPHAGGVIVFVIMLIAAGSLSRIAYEFAWCREDVTPIT